MNNKDQEGSGQLITNILHYIKEPTEVKIESQLISGNPLVMVSGEGVQIVGDSISLNIATGRKIENFVMNSKITVVHPIAQENIVTDSFDSVIDEVNQSSHSQQEKQDIIMLLEAFHLLEQEKSAETSSSLINRLKNSFSSEQLVKVWKLASPFVLELLKASISK